MSLPPLLMEKECITISDDEEEHNCDTLVHDNHVFLFMGLIVYWNWDDWLQQSEADS